jgi:hypothetical protein
MGGVCEIKNETTARRYDHLRDTLMRANGHSPLRHRHEEGTGFTLPILKRPARHDRESDGDPVKRLDRKNAHEETKFQSLH